MAKHVIYGVGPTLLTSQPSAPYYSSILYWEPTSIGILNTDGTFTYYTGTNFVYDSVNNYFTSGKVDKISHFDASGLPLDELSQINFEFGVTYNVDFGSLGNLLAGDDVIDARVRLNNAVVDDLILAQTGNDTIYSGSGNDTVLARDGNDKVYAGIGYDRLIGGNGSDTLYGEAGNDVLIGDDGQNAGLSGTSNADVLDGGSGADILWGGVQNDTLIGGSGTDTAVYVELFSELLVQRTATGFSVTVNGNEVDQLTSVERIAANDGVYAWNVTTETWNKISSKSGIELAAEAGKVYTGTIVSDVLNLSTPNFGAAPYQAFYMNAGDDTLTLGQLYTWNEVAIYGGAGNDTLKAQSNFITAAHIDGGTGNDNIQGSFGDDSLLGNTGNDFIEGRLGNDVMSGGSGADTFAFAIVASGTPQPFVGSSSGNDVITDFVVGTDRLVLDATSTKTVVDTAAGLQVNMTYDVAYYSPDGEKSIIQETATILLRGVHGQYNIDDLMLV